MRFGFGYDLIGSLNPLKGDFLTELDTEYHN